eukprot:m.270664 g.270664  ORF g.270664 m.270664 type:complete len:140 (+) comp16265_c1_seq22:1128-1547(+)
MAGLYLISCLLFLSSLDAKSRKHQDPKKLQIGVTRRPQDCQLKTKHGDLISVHYTGYLVQKPRDVLDTSREREPFKFTLGHGQVIQGWDKGLTGMCVGEVRKLVVPHDLAYGELGAPPTVPANASMAFDVELLHVERQT